MPLELKAQYKPIAISTIVVNNAFQVNAIPTSSLGVYLLRFDSAIILLTKSGIAQDKIYIPKTVIAVICNEFKSQLNSGDVTSDLEINNLETEIGNLIITKEHAINIIDNIA